jgi:hypothetical protein
MSEPGAGTDVLGMSTTARKAGDGSYYTLNGAKMWITNGTLDGQGTGDVFLVYAKTGVCGYVSVCLTDCVCVCLSVHQTLPVCLCVSLCLSWVALAYFYSASSSSPLSALVHACATPSLETYMHPNSPTHHPPFHRFSLTKPLTNPHKYIHTHTQARPRGT